MSNIISPLLSTKLNNTTNNKTINSNSQASTAIQSNGDNDDTFIKRNKKKIIIGSAMGATLAAVGFVLLAKSGKLGNKCQEFVNNIFHFKDKTNPTSKLNTSSTTTNVAKQLSSDEIFEQAKNKLASSLIPPKEISQDKLVEWYMTSIDELADNMSGISKDIASWHREDWQSNLQKEIDKSLGNLHKSLSNLSYSDTLSKLDEIEAHLKKIGGYHTGAMSEFSKFKNSLLDIALKKSETIPVGDIVSKSHSTTITESYDISEEFSTWVANCRKINSEFEKEYGQGKTPSLLFSDFAIKPHNYQDDTSVGMLVSGKSCMPCVVDYMNHRFNIGVAATDSPLVSNEQIKIDYRTKNWARKHLGKFLDSNNRNGYYGTLITGTTSDGRKIVRFNTNYRYANLPNMDMRGSINECYTLISEGSEFTQAQKDIIRIFLDKDNQKYMNGSSFSPLQFSIAPSSINSDEVAHNKTAFFSAIQSWAKQSKEVDVDSILQQAGDSLIIEKGRITGSMTRM